MYECSFYVYKMKRKNINRHDSQFVIKTWVLSVKFNKTLIIVYLKFNHLEIIIIVNLEKWLKIGRYVRMQESSDIFKYFNQIQTIYIRTIVCTDTLSCVVVWM